MTSHQVLVGLDRINVQKRFCQINHLKFDWIKTHKYDCKQNKCILYTF